MEAAADPAGVPWAIAVPVAGGLCAAVVALWGARIAASKTYGKLLREKDRLIAEGVAAREELRKEKDSRLDACERRADNIEADFRDHLSQSIEILAHARASRSRDPLYPPRAPAVTLAGMKKEFRNLSQVISPEDLRKARQDMDRTA